jgi:hypothetical protein
MTSHDPEAVELRTRTILNMRVCDDTFVVVDHVYEPDGVATCDDCGEPAHDPGMVGLMMSDGDDVVSALMDPGRALMIAERLQRAASLVMESGEDVADVEREAARYAMPLRRAPGEPEAGAA